MVALLEVLMRLNSIRRDLNPSIIALLQLLMRLNATATTTINATKPKAPIILDNKYNKFLGIIFAILTMRAIDGIKKINFKNKKKTFFGIIKLFVAIISPIKIIMLAILIFIFGILFMNKILKF